MSSIRFPGLGLEFNINPVAFSIFGKEVYWYGIIISCAFLVAIVLAQRSAKRFGINPDDIIDMALFAIPAAIIGARIYYVVFRWGDYASHPSDIIAIWKGGLAIYGAVLAAIVTAYVFARKRKIGVFKLFDFTVPYLALGQAIGRWGNFVNQEAYGAETKLPWRMEIMSPDGLSRIAVHPTFLYESLWSFAAFIFLIWYRKRGKLPGEVFFLYMILYGIGRFWIEGLRTDSLMLGEFRISQILAGVFAVSMTIIFAIRRRLSLNKGMPGKDKNATLAEK